MKTSPLQPTALVTKGLDRVVVRLLARLGAERSSGNGLTTGPLPASGCRVVESPQHRLAVCPHGHRVTRQVPLWPTGSATTAPRLRQCVRTGLPAHLQPPRKSREPRPSPPGPIARRSPTGTGTTAAGPSRRSGRWPPTAPPQVAPERRPPPSPRRHPSCRPTAKAPTGPQSPGANRAGDNPETSQVPGRLFLNGHGLEP